MVGDKKKTSLCWFPRMVRFFFPVGCCPQKEAVILAAGQGDKCFSLTSTARKLACARLSKPKRHAQDATVLLPSRSTPSTRPKPPSNGHPQTVTMTPTTSNKNKTTTYDTTTICRQAQAAAAAAQERDDHAHHPTTPSSFNFSSRAYPAFRSSPFHTCPPVAYHARDMKATLLFVYVCPTLCVVSPTTSFPPAFPARLVFSLCFENEQPTGRGM